MIDDKTKILNTNLNVQDIDGFRLWWSDPTGFSDPFFLPEMVEFCFGISFGLGNYYKNDSIRISRRILGEEFNNEYLWNEISEDTKALIIKKFTEVFNESYSEKYNDTCEYSVFVSCKNNKGFLKGYGSTVDFHKFIEDIELIIKSSL